MSTDDAPTDDAAADATSDGTVELAITPLDNDRAQKATTSTQLPERRIRTRGKGIRPPYNPDGLAAFMELNETHAVAIRKKARYEVGFGFELAPHEAVESDDADETERAVVEAFWHSRESRWQTGPDRSAAPTTPEEVKELARQDYHSVGWCCLEILTDAEGVPVGLAHVPANTVRVRKPPGRSSPVDGEDGDRQVDHRAPAGFAARGYVQVLDGRTRFFGEAGDRYRGLEATITGTADGEEPPRVTYTPDPDDDREPIFVDRESGDVARGSAETLDNQPANELIFVKNPTPLEQEYGIPDWVSAIRTITADEAAKDYNREFFDNDTIPRMVIKVTGGELSEESKSDLRQMLHGLREESHRTVILEVEKFSDALEEDVTIELEPLGQGISEEMDFREFRAKNEHEIAKVHEVPPIMIGVTETSNRSNSREQVHAFATEVIQPEQHKFSERLYRVLHQQALGVMDWTIEYVLRGADQPKEEAAIAQRKIQAVHGAVPVGRALELIGEDPLPEEHVVDNDTLVSQVGSQPGGGGGGDGDPPGDGDVEGTTESARPAAAPPPANKIDEREWASVEAELLTKDPIETMQFDSSNLDEGLYDFGENELFLSFERPDGPNSLYAYVDVPASVWSGLVSASSHGSYHYDNIRLDYAYIEITSFHSRLPEGPTPDPEDIPEGVPGEI